MKIGPNTSHRSDSSETRRGQQLRLADVDISVASQSGTGTIVEICQYYSLCHLTHAPRDPTKPRTILWDLFLLWAYISSQCRFNFLVARNLMAYSVYGFYKLQLYNSGCCSNVHQVLWTHLCRGFCHCASSSPVPIHLDMAICPSVLSGWTVLKADSFTTLLCNYSHTGIVTRPVFNVGTWRRLVINTQAWCVFIRFAPIYCICCCNCSIFADLSSYVFEACSVPHMHNDIQSL